MKEKKPLASGFLLFFQAHGSGAIIHAAVVLFVGVLAFFVVRAPLIQMDPKRTNMRRRAPVS